MQQGDDSAPEFNQYELLLLFIYVDGACCITMTQDRKSYSNAIGSDVGVLHLRFFIYQDNSYKQTCQQKRDNIENSASGRRQSGCRNDKGAQRGLIRVESTIPWFPPTES